MTTFLTFLFWTTLFLCSATYFFYPAALVLLSRFRKIRVNKNIIEPTVSILIAAYNEEKDILRKIINTLSLDYPEEKMEILIGSDGSTDDTVQVAQRISSSRVQIYPFPINRGKTSVQNDLVANAKGDILVFTDAASFLNVGAIRNIVRNFADPQVGCVAGRMRFVNTDDNLTTRSQGLYWRYEGAIRALESRMGSLIGVDGPLYAVRRQLYVPLASQAISDLLTPLLVLEQGKKVVLEPDAIVDEDPTRQSGHEFKTRRRITLRGLTGLAMYRKLLNPLRNPSLALQIFFHKVLRWFVGPLVIMHLLACLALSGQITYRAALVVYVAFFIAAAAGWLFESRGGKNRLLTVPYYFSLVNLAATMGIIDFFRKKQATSWKPVRF
ncbi:MAG: glycosyltransferase family 2 protein [Desulfuromonadales bacterium]|nr:glycosyltransferase family 2 protein [Desulfuromonadales bacterium]